MDSGKKHWGISKYITKLGIISEHLRIAIRAETVPKLVMLINLLLDGILQSHVLNKHCTFYICTVLRKTTFILTLPLVHVTRKMQGQM